MTPKVNMESLLKRDGEITSAIHLTNALTNTLNALGLTSSMKLAFVKAELIEALRKVKMDMIEEIVAKL